MFHVATSQDIKDDKLSDVYFYRTQQILKAKKIDKSVTVEFVVKKFPEYIFHHKSDSSEIKRTWGVFAGLEEATCLLENLELDLWTLPEGTIFHENQPVMVIKGKYLDFGIYETALLGLLCQASGVATKAARLRKLVGNKILLSFGARRMHPAIAPMIERNAYIGGCDGVAVVKSAELLNIEPSGTIPHALILILGDTVEAITAFNEIIDKKIKRIALIDTFQDEKFEALRVAETLGAELFAIRLDTPGSRRGDFHAILQEVRWELDLRGFKKVNIVVLGGIDENIIPKINDLVDSYGIGTAISNAPVLDYSMDIVEIEDKPIAKRGKMSGQKQLWRCPTCMKSVVAPISEPVSVICDCGSKPEPLLTPLIQSGKLIRSLPNAQQIRDFVLNQLSYFELG